jgi:type III secretion protein Q
MVLPFDLPRVSRGHAALSPGARRAGEQAAARAAASLAELIGLEVRIDGRPLPALPSPSAGSVRLGLELAALPGRAILEVEAGWVARLVELISGGPRSTPGATALTPVEHSALELLVLAALDGAALDDQVAERLAPRLVRDAEVPASPLVVDLAVAVGEARGRARLLLPEGAVAALAGPAELPEPLLAFPLFASLRGGAAPLLPEELAALAPGDVLLADPPAGGRHRLVFPGGFTAMGPVSEGTFHVESTSMDTVLAQVPVVLEIELARVPLTLSDLSRLVPGATLPVQLDRRGLVTLRLGDRTFGRGELVEIDGAVGVRLLALEVTP